MSLLPKKDRLFLHQNRSYARSICQRRELLRERATSVSAGRSGLIASSRDSHRITTIDHGEKGREIERRRDEIRSSSVGARCAQENSCVNKFRFERLNGVSRVCSSYVGSSFVKRRCARGSNPNEARNDEVENKKASLAGWRGGSASASA